MDNSRVHDQQLLSVKQLFDLVNLDKNILNLFWDGGTSLDYEFEINPLDFIRYAELDLQENTQRGLINCLSNSKRAIDAEFDKVLRCFGLYSKKYNFPKKMEIFKQLGMITPRILGKVVQRRNYLEHEYRIPDREQVEDAIDVANLFILTMDGILFSFPDSFTMSNDLPEDHECYGKYPRENNIEKEIYVRFDENKKLFKLDGYIFDIRSEDTWNDRPTRFIGTSTMTPKNPCYPYLLALAYNSIKRSSDFTSLYQLLIDSL